MIEKGILKMLVSKNWEIGKRIQTRNEGVLGKHTIGREENDSEDNGRFSRYNRPEDPLPTPYTNKQANQTILCIHIT